MQSGSPVFRPKMGDLFGYFEDLFALAKPGMSEKGHVGRMKKFLNFVGLSVDAGGEFLYAMRRSRTRDELFLVCERFMISEGREEMDFPLEPFEGLASVKGQTGPGKGEGVSIHSLRLSLGALLRDWWAAMAAFSTYGFLLAAQPQEWPSRPISFLFPCLLWFYFRPGLRKSRLRSFLPVAPTTPPWSAGSGT